MSLRHTAHASDPSVTRRKRVAGPKGLLAQVAVVGIGLIALSINVKLMQWLTADSRSR